MVWSDFAAWHRPSEPRPGSLGIWCDAGGVTIGEAVPLLCRDGADGEWRPRPVEELNVVFSAGYGNDVDATDRTRGLGAVARALNNGDVAKAQIITLLLRLPDLADERASDRLKKWDRAIDLLKAGYNPDQPRNPKGARGGGQWSGSGGDESPTDPRLQIGGNNPPEPIDAPPKQHNPEQVLRMLWRATKALLPEMSWEEALTAALRAVGERSVYLIPFITSSIEPDPSPEEIQEQASRLMRERQALESEPKPIEELYASSDYESFATPAEFAKGFEDEEWLVKRFGRAGDGMDWMHLVEQRAEGPDVDNYKINSTRNIIRGPHTLNEEMNGIYGSRDDEDFGGKTPREALKGKPFEEQRDFAIKTLRKIGVIQ